MATQAVIIAHPENIRRVFVPFFLDGAPAGKPEAPEDNEIPEDLMEYLIQNPGDTFGLRVRGESMEDAGLDPGDFILVDRAVPPRPNSIVVVSIDGEFTIKRVSKVGSDLFLVPANRSMTPTKVRDDQDCDTWGVVTWILKSCR